MKKNQICICDMSWRIRSVLRFVFSLYEDRLFCRGCGETKIVTCQSKSLKFLLLALILIIFASILILLTIGGPAPPDTNGKHMTRWDARSETFENFPVFYYLIMGVPAFFFTCLISVPVIQFTMYLCWRKSGTAETDNHI